MTKQTVMNKIRNVLLRNKQKQLDMIKEEDIKLVKAEPVVKNQIPSEKVRSMPLENSEDLKERMRVLSVTPRKRKIIFLDSIDKVEITKMARYK